MANVFTDSMENYDTLAKLLAKWNGLNLNANIAEVQVGAAFAISAAAQGIALTGAGIGRIVPQAQHYFGGIREKLVSGFTSDANGLIRLGDGSGTDHIEIDWHQSTGLLVAFRGGSYTGGSRTQIAISTLTIAAGSTHRYEWEVLVASSGGVFNLWVDGTLYITFSGNTQQTSNGFVASVGYYAGGNGKVIYLNDAYINDTTGVANTGLEGNITIRSFKVTASGAHIAFRRGGVDTGSNAGQLNKTFADDASINFSFDAGDIDNFIMAAVASGTLNGARLWCFAQQSGATLTSRAMSLLITVGSSDFNLATLTLLQGYGWFSINAGIDPSTSAAWASLAALNAAKWGYKLQT